MTKKYSASRALYIEELARVESEKLTKKVDKAIIETLIKEDCKVSELTIGVDMCHGVSTGCILKVLKPGTKDQRHEVVRFI